MLVHLLSGRSCSVVGELEDEHLQQTSNSSRCGAGQSVAAHALPGQIQFPPGNKSYLNLVPAAAAGGPPAVPPAADPPRLYHKLRAGRQYL